MTAESTNRADAAHMHGFGCYVSVCRESWVLVERFLEDYPDDWRLVFKRGDGMTLEVSVPEDVYRAFDGIKVTS